MNKKSALLITVAGLLVAVSSYGQAIERIEPPSWFTGMKEGSLQLMVYGKNVSAFDVTANYPGVEVTTLVKTDNPNYLFVNLRLAPETPPGNLPLVFRNGKRQETVAYPLTGKPVSKPLGFDCSDVIYLLMPDRFANGDSTNDNVDGMADRVNRSDPGGRHGGDIKGITDHLDYLCDLGVTGVWLNPFLENDQPSYSYHGYSTTDFYKADPRYGSNDEFRSLVNSAHQKGLKVIMDMIFNHIGSGHWWMKDLPASDWIHQFSTFTRTNYRASIYMDPYASDIDRKVMEEGWFDKTMPDLNQDNPLVETYLTQNSLWWIAYSGLDGIRMDTYPYPQPSMMARWAKRVTEEFPGFFIVGEVWYDDPGHASYWSYKKVNSDGYVSNLPSLTDLPLCFATHTAFGSKNPNEGLMKLYNTLSLDFLYPEPQRNVIFLDNHDMTRFFTETGEDPDIYRLGLSFILTTRGIPQFYYGTEILMPGDQRKGDGFLREDFPGGWPGDRTNAFTSVNITPEQKEAMEFTRRLLNWRKSSDIIGTGMLKHYIPEEGIYVYFRYNLKGSIMVILNNNPGSRTIGTQRFSESLRGFTGGYEVISGREIENLSEISIEPRSAMIIELK